jgi:RNA polymerase sigma-70 factor (ECF subfamily)
MEDFGEIPAWRDRRRSDSVDETGRASFLAYFAAHEEAIRARVRRLVPLRSDAEDVMQEVAVVLWRKFPEFRPEQGFREWAFGVARYEALAWYRDRGRERIAFSTETVEMLAALEDAEASHGDRRREALDRCMAKLAEADRDLILASYRPAARIQDVAMRSGRSIGGFYQWLHRMRKTLLECVRAEVRRDERARGNEHE